VSAAFTMNRQGYGPALHLQDLSVRLNDGTAFVGDTDVAIEPGERVLIAGESGSGKSTLVRAIAGLWPWGGGSIEVKRDAKMFLLPQRPYVPTGTLRRAASYPYAPESRSLNVIADTFKRVGLEHLADKLQKDGPWDHTLSGGEKQRLAFARVLLHNPDIVVLDEATAALDPKSQVKLMELLVDREGMTLVSVGHRPELEAFHTRKIVLERRVGDAKLVRDVELIEPAHRILWRQLRRLAKSPSRTRATA
jgi:vitamin B12/bleomycin/antimicrobial peptide transport system ATP-binding/permease protein